MRLRPIVTGAVGLVAALLAACSSNVGITPTSPPPLPTPAPSFHYAGSMTQTFTYQYGYPSTQPPLAVKTKIVDQVTVFTTAAPTEIPAGATLDAHIVENDSTALQMSMTTTDAYLAQSSKSMLLFGAIAEISEASGGQSSTTTTIYPKPRIVSESSGTWTNSPSATIDETYSDGHYEDRTIAANGTYSEKGTTFSLKGKSAVIQVHEQSSGSGSYSGPFGGCPPNTSFDFSAPSGSPPKIMLSATSSNPYCALAPIPIEAWYSAPPRFYDERDASRSAAIVPTQCGSFAGAKATDVSATIVTLDTVIGYVERSTIDTYAQSTGPICLVLADEISNYYDWQGDTTSYPLYFSQDAKPVSEIVTTEVLTRTSAPPSSSSTLSSAIVAGAQAHFSAKIDAVRAKLLETLVRHSRDGK